MKVTIITVYRCQDADTQTAVVEGELSAEQRAEIAGWIDLRDWGEEQDIVGFVTMDLVKPAALSRIVDAFPSETTIAGTRGSDEAECHDLRGPGE